MTATNLYHALGLHMHQPPGNLALLIKTNPWEAEEIIRCYERAARYALSHRGVARLHVGFSGILLAQLMDPAIIDAYRHIVDIPEMLARYREADNVELIGMGYYHPIFPLIPRADWGAQLARGRAIMEEVFGRVPRGFWPPEMAFSMEMIPELVKAGYEYVVVDGVHVRPEDGLADGYRPYLACHEGVCITVVPRDRSISSGQESGLDPGWFARECISKTAQSPRASEPRLVTTWSDGENGGWFRQTHEESGFFGHFFSPYMERVQAGDFPVVPVGLSDYLRRNPATGHALVQTGAWNVGSTSGDDFRQWAGSERRRDACAAIHDLSRRWWDLRRRSAALSGEGRRALARARDLILEAQTSCFLFWGDDWIPQLYARTEAAERALERAEREPGSAGPGRAEHASQAPPAPPGE
jgi:alpha-amylase/alpha-mannosidase (GH57 family)